MSESRIPVEEVVARGEALYWNEIHDKIPPGNEGKFVVIDVNSGDYELDPRDAEATMRLLARRPDAMTYGIRVGHSTAYTLLHVMREVR
jgi:hypothetical protein